MKSTPRRRAPALSLAVCSALAIALGTAGCASSARRQATSLLAAVDRFRAAADAVKPSRVAGVEAVACTEARVCEAKRVCLDAIEPTARAMALKAEVVQRLTAIEQKQLSPASRDARALPPKLDEAKRLLEQGRAKMTDCERKMADLRAFFGV